MRGALNVRQFLLVPPRCITSSLAGLLYLCHNLNDSVCGAGRLAGLKSNNRIHIGNYTIMKLSGEWDSSSE